MVDGDADSHRGNLLAALEALVAELDEARQAFRIGHDTLMRMQERAETAEARVRQLETALRGYGDHQSWRCGHPDRYAQNPDCPCGLVQTWRALGWTVEYVDDAAVLAFSEEPT